MQGALVSIPKVLRVCPGTSPPPPTCVQPGPISFNCVREHAHPCELWSAVFPHEKCWPKAFFWFVPALSPHQEVFPRTISTKLSLHCALFTPIIRNCMICCSQALSTLTATIDESGSGDPCVCVGCLLARMLCEFLGRSGLELLIFSHLALNGFFCLFNTGSHKAQAGPKHTILLP